jgi:hypothetical protein
VAWLFRESLFEGGVFYVRDIHLVWVPQVEAFVRAIAAGSWPVWDASLGFGQPLLADPSAQVLYPPTWLNLVLRPWTYYTAFAFGHVLFSGAGLYALARRWELSPAASFLASAAWVLSGPFVSLVDLWHHFAGAAWMPLVVLAGDRALEQPGGRRTLGFALALAAQVLAGSADMCLLTGLVVGGLLATRHVEWRRGRGRANAARLAVAAAAVLLAGGLTAPLWLSALDVVSRAARLSLPATMRTYWSVHPLSLLEVLVPGLWTTLPLAPSLRAALFESREPFLRSLYLGLPVLALAGAGFALSDHPRRRLLGSLGLLAVLLALGRHTPFYGVATFVLVPLRIVRYPVKAMVLAAFAVALLAGLGFEAWRTRTPWPRRRAALAVVALPLLLAVLACAAALALRLVPGRFGPLVLDAAAGAAPPGVVFAGTALRLAAAGALAVVAAALAAARLRAPRAAGWLAAALAVAALGDLAVYHRRPNPVAPRDLYTHRPEVLEALGPPGEARVYVYDYSAPGKSERYLGRAAPYALHREPEGWPPDASAALAMQMYLAPQAAGRWGVSESYDIDYRGLYSTPLDQLTRVLREVERTPVHTRLLRMAGVTRVVSLHAQGFEELALVRAVAGLFPEPIRVFAVPDPLPHAYAVAGHRPGDGVAGLGVLLDPSFDPRREVVLPEGPGAPVEDPADAPIGTVRVVERRADRVRLEADLARPGYVVLLQTFDPGWRAAVDGRPAGVLPANVVFCGVRVGDGRHVVEYVYRPRPLYWGLATAGASGLVAIALGAHRRRDGAGAGAER